MSTKAKIAYVAVSLTHEFVDYRVDVYSRGTQVAKVIDARRCRLVAPKGEVPKAIYDEAWRVARKAFT